MRHFAVYLFFFSLPAIAADCLNITGPFPQNCDNLYITSSQNLSAEPGPIEVIVSGVVEIRADIILNGLPGNTLNTGPAAGGTGGPSATPGGGLDGLLTPQDGQDGVTANGKAAPSDATCSNGGGGGGMFTPGDNGGICSTATVSTSGAGGAVAPNTEFDFGLNFRGGYGGGAGGISSAVVGAGGGGGGALKISATGNVTIFSGSTIYSRGGDGGDATTTDGPGGGGSGGALWIESSGTILNFGTLDLRGGSGGVNSTSNTIGGQGGDGVYQFEDLNGTRNGSGLVLPSSTSGSSSSSKLTSDISCGTISKQSDYHNLYFIALGFALIFLLLPPIRRTKKLFSSF